MARGRRGGRHVRRLDPPGGAAGRGRRAHRHTHAEAFITEPVPLPLRNTIELADFCERIHGRNQAVAVGFSPDPNGALVVTEAVTQTDELHYRSSSWGLASMAAELLRLYPALTRVRAVRAWAVPTAFTPDDEPVIGWLPERDSLFVVLPSWRPSSPSQWPASG